MIPSSATPRRRRRPRNAASASARALAAGLWRLRHAERMMAAAGASPPRAAAQTQPSQEELKQGRRRPASHLCCYGNKRRADHVAAAESHCQCRNNNGGILDKIDACLECPSAFMVMEKATKWDDIFFTSPSPSTSPSPLLLLRLMEAGLEKARGHVHDLEHERFLRRLGEEKAAWKSRVRDKARHAVASLRDELGVERRHRRQLEQANAKLLRDLASAKQQAQSYEKARELMEDACSELSREVEEDQAEVELLRRECLRLREEMKEERRMLQVAEVWREERVQMKLSDAKLALENKYAQLDRLQAEMEAFLRSKDDESASHSVALREAARLISQQDAVEKGRYSSSSSLASSNKSNDDDMLQSVSPATDLFLADGGSSGDLELDSCSWVGTSDRSAAWVANGNSGVTTTEARSSGGASRRSTKNTALIRRLWRSAITESRNKTAGSGRTAAADWSPSYSSDRRRSSVTAEGPPAVAVAGEQCSSSGSGSGLPLPQQLAKQKPQGMDDQNTPLHAHYSVVINQKP